ncbi:MAG TPA: hypothetical protein VJ846_05770, partial [Sphingomicrobium sp.]|nr:hypothetical protein [Sphingomicrobium sp.]
MRSFQCLGIGMAALACLSCSSRPKPRVPEGYPASYAEQIAAANKEGELDILSATDARKAAGVIAQFRRRYPGIKL